MKILVINTGSSSLKYQLIDMKNETVLAKGLCDRVGVGNSFIKHTKTGNDPVIFDVEMKTIKKPLRKLWRYSPMKRQV